MESRRILAGFDGSPEAVVAVRWAAVEAARRGDDLEVMTAYDWRVIGAPALAAGSYAQQVQAQAGALVETALGEAKAAAPTVPARGEAVLGAPGAALIEASPRASLLVVGCRGRGGVASLLLGSVGHQVATHAASSVVVVRGRTDPAGSVVVGTDGSESARRAVAVAYGEAAARGATLVAVRAYPQVHPPWGDDRQAFLDERRTRSQVAYNGLLADVAAAAGPYPDVEVTTVVSDAPAVEMLVEASRTAQLVVVGTRGHGGFTGLLLGSVGLHLIQRAECPVLIAR